MFAIHPDGKDYRGTKLREYLEEINIFGKHCNEKEKQLREIHLLMGDYRYTPTNDGGVTTRANIPFLPPPPQPQFVNRETLHELMNIISLIQDSFRDGRLEGQALDEFHLLMHPIVTLMSNLPGGVHNCSVETIFKMVEKLKFNSKRTVLLELGSGAPIFGLGASIFTKRTLCVDLPDVMKTVHTIISCMKDEDSLFVKTIHLVSGHHSFLFLSHFIFCSGYSRNEVEALRRCQLRHRRRLFYPRGNYSRHSFYRLGRWYVI